MWGVNEKDPSPGTKKSFAQQYGLKADSAVTAETFKEDYIEEVGSDKTIYKAESLANFARNGVNGKSADTNKDGKIDRPEWVLARQRQWFQIWIIPALAALATCIVFWIGFKDPKKTATV